MHDAKKYALMGVVVLITLIVYNTFLKTYAPQGLRTMIGLG